MNQGSGIRESRIMRVHLGLCLLCRKADQGASSVYLDYWIVGYWNFVLLCGPKQKKGLFLTGLQSQSPRSPRSFAVAPK